MPTQYKFKGKAIYSPSGKAGEYSYWACNFYVGCSNGCTYCYLKKGRCKAIMGGDVPTLKKCFFGSEYYALFCFESELNRNLSELQKHGLFFSFTTDPMLRETFDLTIKALKLCLLQKVPVKILTKVAIWVDLFILHEKNSSNSFLFQDWKKYVAFGFTLTGHDELEPAASTNAERIEAAKKLKNAGFKIFFSIEPIVDFKSAIFMIWKTYEVCDLYKVGLMSGKKYSKIAASAFVKNLCIIFKNYKFYFKDSLLKQAGIERESLPANCVTRDYNIFE